MCGRVNYFFLIFSGNALLLAQANVPFDSGSTKENNYSNNDDGIPLLSNHQGGRLAGGERHRSVNRSSIGNSRRSSRKRRIRQEDRSGVDDTLSSSFFSEDDEYDDMGYEREQTRQRRSRNRRNRQNQDDKSVLLFGLGAQIDSLRSWTERKTGIRIPRINIYCDPVTILKIRKAWSIPGMVCKVGADLETYRLSGGYWRFRACFEDKFLHGRFTLKEIQNIEVDDEKDVLVEYSKSWVFANTVGASTRFNMCAAYSIAQRSGGVRFGIRNDAGVIGRVTSSPFNGNQRFSIIPVLNLDEDERFKVEVKTNVEVPNPELVLGLDLEGRNGSVGIGGSVDIEVEELNLIASF